MKKIFIAAIVAMCAGSANAQIWVGGEVGFNFENVKATDKTSTSISLIPEVGYKLSENWDVACSLGFGVFKQAVEDADTETAFKIDPYVRYTFAKTGNVAFFLDGGVDYETVSTGGARWGVGVRPGIAFSVTPKIGLVGHLGYLGYEKDTDSLGGNSRFGLGVNGTDLSVGVYFNI